MTATRAHYGVQDNAGTTDDASDNDCRWTIQAAEKIAISGNTFERSNQFYSNDFFYFYHAGGNLTVTLDYDLTGSTTADLDLLVYKDGYTYGVGDDLLAYSMKEKGSGSGKEDGSEYISKSTPAGYYMINVMYYNDGVAKPATVYNLTISNTASPNNVICR